jgi:hypothetical protein
MILLIDGSILLRASAASLGDLLSRIWTVSCAQGSFCESKTRLKAARSSLEVKDERR